MDSWILRLKAGYDAGYYKTEAAEGKQEAFPWQGKVCKDCPFWLNSVCRVDAVQRSPHAHTCSYFDPWNRDAAKQVIAERMRQARRAWWDQMGR
ncbi:MAG TPA: hypothetical protein VKX16_02805 [Chloroflexota bacterium]|nr:hypothetical protein [Chloroflexota bacterium]